jgi:hypothetical protein
VWARTLLQRAKKCGATYSCESCAQRPEHTHVAPPEVTEVLSRTGEQLDVPTRLLARKALGRDFSHVRVHTDAPAAASAHSVDALAYTVGRHIVFGPGRYAPRTPAGNALLLHELTHVVQQDGREDVTQGPIAVGPADTPHEREASRAGQQGISAVSPAPQGPLLQRQVVPTEIEEAGPFEELELAAGSPSPTMPMMGTSRSAPRPRTRSPKGRSCWRRTTRLPGPARQHHSSDQARELTRNRLQTSGSSRLTSTSRARK